ncbi:F-box/kelch-repeat protein At3g23880-like [Lotus japonicus]|uniref:F-box/kelch-repeat protein At3g23880-like n=1 Tax=Lotus japonicus TaxID=34305 RepID=UPI00258545CE|nr:F-box/kelch-repeat protein At3g23880-like [Lotus japonicus]
MENEKEKNLTLPHQSNVENEKKKNNNKYPTLPHELIIEILLRLPVRSVLRFRRVCKSWSSLISDPHFAKSHFDFNAAPTHRLLLRFINENRARVQSFDLASSLGDRSAVKTLNFPSPPMSCDHNPLHFLGSCRGFMLLAYERTGDVIVWNPTTGFHKQILDIDHEFMFSYLCGFGYDNSTDDYFVVVITLYLPKTEIRVFSLKTKSWCDIKYVNVRYMDCGYNSGPGHPGVFLNGSLHWQVTRMDTGLDVVIAFDLVKNSLSDIPLSSELAAEWTEKVYYLRELGGYLSMCYAGGSRRRERAEIWVMKEYKVQSSWTKAFVTTVCDIPRRRFYPICFIEGGGVVGSNGHGRLLKFNAKGKLLEHLKYDREYENGQKYFEMYRESLLFFPGEQRLLCVTEDEESEDAEEEETIDEDTSEYEYSISEEEYSTEDEDATEDEETTKDEYATEGEKTTDDEEEN